MERSDLAGGAFSFDGATLRYGQPKQTRPVTRARGRSVVLARAAPKRRLESTLRFTARLKPIDHGFPRVAAPLATFGLWRAPGHRWQPWSRWIEETEKATQSRRIHYLVHDSPKKTLELGTIRVGGVGCISIIALERCAWSPRGRPMPVSCRKHGSANGNRTRHVGLHGQATVGK